VIVGQRVSVHTSNGPIPGVIGKKPIHLLTADERDKGKVELHDLWIDLGVTGGKDEVLAAGVQLGDCVTYSVGFQQLLGDRIAARALDNRIGAWVVAEALRRVKEMNPQVGVFAVASVQEEIGYAAPGRQRMASTRRSGSPSTFRSRQTTHRWTSAKFPN
jgi:endoglucanase